MQCHNWCWHRWSDRVRGGLVLSSNVCSQAIWPHSFKRHSWYFLKLYPDGYFEMSASNMCIRCIVFHEKYPIKRAASTQCCVRIGWLILSETETLFYTEQVGHLLTLKGAKVLLFLKKRISLFMIHHCCKWKLIAKIFQLKGNTFYLINV